MERLHLQSIGACATAGIAMLLIGLAVWATWGSPSTVSLTWAAAVGVGLILAIATAVRDGSATRSVAHVLYDAEHPSADTSVKAAGRQSRP